MVEVIVRDNAAHSKQWGAGTLEFQCASYAEAAEVVRAHGFDPKLLRGFARRKLNKYRVRSLYERNKTHALILVERG